MKVKFTKIHTNALSGLFFQSIITAGLIFCIYMLISNKVEANGARELIIGALIPTIGNSIREIASISKRFTYIKDEEED